MPGMRAGERTADRQYKGVVYSIGNELRTRLLVIHFQFAIKDCPENSLRPYPSAVFGPVRPLGE